MALPSILPRPDVTGRGRFRAPRPRIVASLAGLVLAAGLAGGLLWSRLPQSPTSATHTITTTTAAVVRADLVTRQQVTGNVAFPGATTIVNQWAPPPSSAQLAQYQDAVSTGQVALNDANAQAAATDRQDAAQVASDQQQLGNDQQKYNADGCTGPSRPPTCAQDQQAIQSDQARLAGDQAKQQSDAVASATKVHQAQGALTSAQDALNVQSQTRGGQGSPPAVFSSLPGAGAVVSQGQSLFAVDGRPIPLLYGDTPFTRTLAAGSSGHDVQELEQDLVSLGFGNGLAADGSFTSADAAVVDRWQASLGVPQTGQVGAGDAVVLTGPARVQSVNVGTGATAQLGATVMTVTAAAPQVVVALDASLQLLVKTGDQVQVDLPDGRTTTPGTITDVSSVATVTPTANPGANGGPRATVSVTVSLTNPAVLGHLDQLPVTVEVATQSVKNVLAVPVNALLALAGGGYAVEVVQPNGSHRLAGVQTGIYDSNLVQVSGPGIAEGMKVVVPAQ